MSKEQRDNLKTNTKRLLQSIRRLNLYVSELNTDIKLDYSRIEAEIDKIKKYLNDTETEVLKDGVQQRLPI